MTLLLVLTAPGAQASTLEVDTSVGAGQVGGYYGLYDPIIDDAPPAFGPTLPPDNDASFQNYFMGRSTFGPLGSSVTSPERRVFFFFDMAGLSIPAGEEITEVSIDLTLTLGGSAVLANFTGDIELVEFSSTPYTPAEILDPDAFALPSDLIWSTFGSSTPYGGFEIVGPDHPTETPTAPGDYAIPLPGSIADVESAILGGSVLVVTAKLATFDPDPIGPLAPPAIDPYEYVFGITDVVSGIGSSVDPPLLSITTTPIPEPASLGLLAVGLLCWGVTRR
jgi:hypothetical protein